MSANVKVKVYKELFATKWEKYKERYLISAGILVSGYQAGNVNVDTGRLKQSMSYITTNGQGAGLGGLSRPTRKDTVKIGSGIIYGQYHERYLAWCKKSREIYLSKTEDTS